MKNLLGINTSILTGLLLFAWSGPICAQEQNLDLAWKRADPGRTWTVTSAGGHMQVGDMFTIRQMGAERGVNLAPEQHLKNRWGPADRNRDVQLTVQNIKGQDYLCGFVEVDTDRHRVEIGSILPLGHGKWHGILIQVKSNNELLIIWSPRSFGHAVRPGMENCARMEIDNHGGMAHANG